MTTAPHQTDAATPPEKFNPDATPSSPNGVSVVRRHDRFSTDSTRVITRFFRIGSTERMAVILRRILVLDPEMARQTLHETHERFADRHKDLKKAIFASFDRVCELFLEEGDATLYDELQALDDTRKQLVGAYFTLEYSVQAAAFFNPSIVPHPDQSGLAPGELRFILSFRATGEGHISSLVFRSGVIGASGEIRFDPVSRYSEAVARERNPDYDKRTFLLKLKEMGCYNYTAGAVLANLKSQFTRHDLDENLANYRQEEDPANEAQIKQTLANIRWLADSNYVLKFAPDTDLSERVIFPVSSNEKNGIEDARFVRFQNDDAERSVTYYATYTAFNGITILPQIIQTHDFRAFKINTLNGSAVAGKGMALFPRKIDGMYHMIGRQDGESVTLMRSDNPHFWHEYEPLQVPKEPWELFQLGNCGSPLETSEGWLLLTHGVGPMRRYCIGATLLDRKDPSKIRGRLRQPLIEPNHEEREGYVPNVLYSCGAMIHDRELVLPYAMSDSASAIATLDLSELLDSLLFEGP